MAGKILHLKELTLRQYYDLFIGARADAGFNA